MELTSQPGMRSREMLVRVVGTSETTPTRQMRDALYVHAPELSAPWEDRQYAFLMVRAVPRHLSSAACWYEVLYAYDVINDMPWGGATLGHGFQHAAWLPAPPMKPGLSLAERLAAAPEPTLDGWSPEQIAMVGGPDAALQVVSNRLTAAITRDIPQRTPDSWDWDQAARTYAQILRAIPPVKLDEAQSAEVAATRQMQAELDLGSAGQSQQDLDRNAARVTQETL